uniref:Acid trehalase-like protein 1-like n=1 Tax=Saccoglossus kowalevskii TaxID=10224 RepID=A0ABM0M656_SACKO|nr:PREDICTED: acid trehalase-like protein 1-like [Saccoglossus kowalevskii]
MDPGEMVHSISREMSGFDKIKEEVMKAKLFNKSNHQGGVKDQSTDPYIFLSDKLPTNNKYMATIGNGFLATVVYGDTVYMNGVYNGFYDHSHRARIPSTGAIQFSLDGKYNGNENYALDVRKVLESDE